MLLKNVKSFKRVELLVDTEQLKHPLNRNKLYTREIFL